MSVLQNNIHEDMLIQSDLIEINEIEKLNEIRKIIISMSHFNISLEEISHYMKDQFIKKD